MSQGPFFKDSLRVSLLNTNYNALSEQKLYAFLGDFQWQCISKTIGIPLSQLQTNDGKEIYGTFFYIEMELPFEHSLKQFKLDDQIDCLNYVRAFKNISVKGEILFDRPEKLDSTGIIKQGQFSPHDKGKHPRVTFGNVFISPRSSNETLKIALSVNGNFNNFLPLPNTENPYHDARLSKESGGFGSFGPDWEKLSPQLDLPSSFRYKINPDRDSNGAGLVYFVNYVAFMDQAERELMTQSYEPYFSEKSIDSRTTVFRKLAYFGNATLSDELCIHVEFYKLTNSFEKIGIKHSIRRKSDDKLICLSECIKVITPEQ